MKKFILNKVKTGKAVIENLRNEPEPYEWIPLTHDEVKILITEIDHITAEKEKAERELRVAKVKLQYVNLAKDHYWDSFEKDKNIIIKHLGAIWDELEAEEKRLRDE